MGALPSGQGVPGAGSLWGGGGRQPSVTDGFPPKRGKSRLSRMAPLPVCVCVCVCVCLCACAYYDDGYDNDHEHDYAYDYDHDYDDGHDYDYDHDCVGLLRTQGTTEKKNC